MTEPPDPLEAELSSLRPQEVSSRLRQRVAERLTVSPPLAARWVWGVALAGGLAAACLAVVWLGRGGFGFLREHSTVQPPTALHHAADDPPPAPEAYQHALAWSPEQLDAWLDRQAVRGSPGDPGAMQVHAFPRSEGEIRALLGEP